jgi:UDP-3-O-[3-hydroxymyristoyl] glucosamine N-acyltransferase
MRLSELARAVSMDVVRDGEFEAFGLLSSRGRGLLGCLYDPAFRRDLSANDDVSCVATRAELCDLVPPRVGLALTLDPRECFYDIQCHLGSATDFYGSDEPTFVSADACVDPRSTIASRNVHIDAGCIVEAGATVLARTTLEEGVVVRSGAIVGAEGFHPVPLAGALRNLPHYGAVRIRRAAEVQSNAVVCRAAFSSPTDIGPETIVGPMVYIAHGVKTGAGCRLAASARVAGSSVLGDRVFVGPNAVVSNRVVVGDDARITLGAVVVRDVPPGTTVTGHFAVEHSRFMADWARLLKS